MKALQQEQSSGGVQDAQRKDTLYKITLINNLIKFASKQLQTSAFLEERLDDHGGAATQKGARFNREPIKKTISAMISQVI